MLFGNSLTMFILNERKKYCVAFVFYFQHIYVLGVQQIISTVCSSKISCSFNNAWCSGILYDKWNAVASQPSGLSLKESQDFSGL